MSDNTFVVDEKPKNKRVIGRVNNELNPSTDQEMAPIYEEIGRINNELHPSADKETVPTQKPIGRVNNEPVDRQ
jgi:hypothetical protein